VYLCIKWDYRFILDDSEGKNGRMKGNEPPHLSGQVRGGGGHSTNPELETENIRHDSEGEGGRKEDESERKGRPRGAEGKEVVGILYIC
jgi:hypothetical protein